MNRHKTILFAVVLLAITVPLALGQETYTQIDVPGASYTGCGGVDTAGDMVGAYGDASGNQNGFLFSGGTYTTIVYSGSTNTSLSGINDLGQIVGNSNASGSGFLYDVATQTFTTISYPHANQTFPYAINNAGTIGGSVNYRFNENLGFESDGSKYRQISPPGTSGVFVTGVTASGELVGNVSNRSGTFFFLFNHGTYGHLTIPNAPGAYLLGINPAGTAVVGYYTPSPGITAGLLYQNKTLTTLQFPGSSATYAAGINAAGEVVGTFVDANFNTHGFTWSTSAEKVKK